jgi:hypothetical protein
LMTNAGQHPDDAHIMDDVKSCFDKGRLTQTSEHVKMWKYVNKSQCTDLSVRAG